MDVNFALEQAGIAGNEAKVYIALIDLGPALAGDITKRSGVNRTLVYDSLDKLMNKGLVSYVIRSNRKYFEAGSADTIISFLADKEKQIKQKRIILEKVIPELESRRNLAKSPQEVNVYKGEEGIKSIAEDVLKIGKELLVFGAEGRFMDEMTYYGTNWHKRRKQLAIPIKIIFNEKIRKKKENARFPMLQMRFHAGLEDTPATTWIYGDKVAILIWSAAPIATIIRSKEVADSYSQTFEILWRDARK